jgi:hypothetical protein
LIPNIWRTCSSCFETVTLCVKRSSRKTGFSAQGSLGVLNRFLSGFQPDGFVLALIGTVAVATLLPCQGMSAEILVLIAFADPG